MQQIKTPDVLRQHIELLVQQAPVFADVYVQTGLPDLRLRAGGFSQLCQTIISQQLSVAAAASIWQRFETLQLNAPTQLLSASEQTLRDCGLSKQKIRYLRSLAEHDIDYAALQAADDETVIATLTSVTGIGRWTAEIYCLFSLNRCDVFAHNDLALQVAAQTMLQLDNRPTEAVMRKITHDWSPHRSAAAYLLWRYYTLIKGREGVN